MAAPVPHSHSGQSGGLTAPRTLVFAVIALFFIWGGLTSLNDILIPKLKGLLCAACGGRCDALPTAMWPSFPMARCPHTNARQTNCRCVQ